MRILITGGAGFVGASLARLFKRENPAWKITALDNLKRRGSELNVPKFKKLGVRFIHGDVRFKGDLNSLKERFDLFIEASGEPSVLAGLDGNPGDVVDANLGGTIHSLEFARKNAGALIFLSSSRVYSIEPLRQIKITESPSRFEIASSQSITGVSTHGISEDFPTHLPRSLYGATKLASEMLIQEYAQSIKLPCVINRCGVIAGAGQFGKAEQGVLAYWAACHYFGKPLRYTGFGGSGKQVRDAIHPQDLFRLIKTQWEAIGEHSGQIFNVGGGRAISVSLLELTSLCQELTGRRIAISKEAQSSPVDIPLYISDYRKAEESFGWKPQLSARFIVEEICGWIKAGQDQLRSVFTSNS